MTLPQFIVASFPSVAALVVVFSWSWSTFPDYFGVVRTVMMVLGGLVVTAIVLIVAVAVISGIIGMIGNLRRVK